MSVETFSARFQFTNANINELKDTVDWIRSNYGTEVKKAGANSQNLDLMAVLHFATFNDLVDGINAFIAQYSTRLSWTFDYRDD